MDLRKAVALVAHDNRKQDLIEWVEWNYPTLIPHHLICTGTTGRLVTAAVRARMIESAVSDRALEMTLLKSGPLGGDQQLGAMIAEGRIDLMIFFWDPMEPQPHDVDVKALLRIAVVYNIPVACNRATADFIISSPLLNEPYTRKIADYGSYTDRDI